MIVSENIVKRKLIIMNYVFKNFKYNILIQSSIDIGNEKVLQNTKIVGDQVREVLDNNDLGETLEFWFEGETYQSCQQECRKRLFFVFTIL